MIPFAMLSKLTAGSGVIVFAVCLVAQSLGVRISNFLNLAEISSGTWEPVLSAVGFVVFLLWYVKSQKEEIKELREELKARDDSDKKRTAGLEEENRNLKRQLDNISGHSGRSKEEDDG